MPTYEYLCKSCGERLEVQQSFSDDALTTCPACAGQLRKLFGSVGITFKGSGFYKTDSRSGSSSSSGSSDSGSGSGSSDSSSSSGAAAASSSSSTPSTTPSTTTASSSASSD